MKKVLGVVILLLVLVGIGFFIGNGFRLTSFLQSQLVYNSPTPIPSKSVPVTLVPTYALRFCTSKDVDPTITIGAAAGNIYGAVAVKNISNSSCHINGNDFISADYNTNLVKNITITHKGQIESQVFTLAPGQTMYSQVHYPNGPQCQSIGIQSTPVTFRYKISSLDTVVFKNQNGSETQIVQTCSAVSDVTEIEIWNMSANPITP